VRPFEVGLVLPINQSFVDGSTTRWAEIRALAVRAEEMGFDTVWTPDELLWRDPETTDGMVWTVKLKEGVKYHNGDPFTAEHVAATYLITAGPDGRRISVLALHSA